MFWVAWLATPWVFLSTLKDELNGRGAAGMGLVRLLVGFLLAWGAIGRSLWRRTTSARRARMLVEAPPTNLVLYLRSFSDEDAAKLADVPRWLQALLGEHAAAAWDLLVGPGTLDSQLAPSIETYVGPMIAVGNPNDSYLRVGAARLFVPDTSWKELVEPPPSLADRHRPSGEYTRPRVGTCAGGVQQASASGLRFERRAHLDCRSVARVCRALPWRRDWAAERVPRSERLDCL